MYRVELPELGFVEVWRDAARRLASHGVDPDEVVWDRGRAGDLFAGSPLPDAPGPVEVRATKALVKLAKSALCHRGDVAPALLYRALHRHQTAPKALANPADPLTRDLARLQKAVGRDIHKMHAFVRFRELPGEGPDKGPDKGPDAGPRRRFGAWFEPDHLIVEAAAPFFARRFADMDWMIATPGGIARFEAGALTFHPAGPRPDLPDDASEALWGTYFANIFNPARLHLKAMRSEMPVKYWKNLPETRLIPEMLEQAETRVAAMRAAMPSTPPERAGRILDRLPKADLPERPGDMDAARRAAAACQRCRLCEPATQTVWGAGDPGAALMIVGEQPGDAEDIAGKPFVGPAGRLLSALRKEAGTGPAWTTNAVKHFKFVPRGKRRLHQAPNRDEIDHCRWWLDLERRFVAPQVTVALGASAAYALTGNTSPLGARRGTVETAHDGGKVLITWHPSYVLRTRGGEAERVRDELLADLETAGRMADALETRAR